MRTLKLITMLAVLAVATVAQAAPVDMSAMAPADAKALIEVNNAAGLRQTLMESKFWAALEETQAFKDWRANEKYAQMRQRIDEFLTSIAMNEDEAIQMYLGQGLAVVLMPSAVEKKPDGVLLLQVAGKTPEESEANAQRLIAAVGAVETGKHGETLIFEVVKDNRTDRIAHTGGVLVMTHAAGDALERVLDTMAGGPSLGATDNFKLATGGLLDGWRIRAYSSQIKHGKAAGAVAVAPLGNGHMHVEWRMLGGEAELAAINEPTVLTSPSALPASCVAAVATAFHPEAIWEKVKAKLGQNAAGGADKLRRAEMFLRGFFPGKTLEQVMAAFGPEAALSLQKGDAAGGAPGVVGLVRLTATGKAVAQCLRDGLAAKAMILAAMADPQKADGPHLNVREETVDQTTLLIIEAPGVIEKLLGDWAKDIALTIAVTDNWMVAGTSVSAVRATVRTATGAETQATLAASLAAKGEKVPTAAVTRWGTICPASGSDIVLGLAEQLAGKDRVDQAKKLTNLAELLGLIERITWESTDTADSMTGRADLQAVE